MFEIEIFFTDDYAEVADSAVFLGTSIIDSLNGFVGVEYEDGDIVKSIWYNKDYVKEITSRRVEDEYN